jgi:multiple sugar transport system permease protein
MRRSKWTGLSFLLPGFCGVAFFSFLPFMDVIRSSFVQVVSGRFCGLENYRIVLHNRAFLLAVKNTLRFLLVCLPLLLGISLVLAFLLHAWQMAFHQKLRLLKAAYLVPMAIPAASLVLLWKLMFDKHGFVNGILHLCGIHAVDWMNTGAAFFVLVFSYIWKNLGYTMVLWLAGLSSISPDLYEAAEMDGAGRMTQFFKITLPLIRPLIFTIVVLSFLNSFKVFREAYLVAGNYPQEDMYLLQHLFNNWFTDLSVDKMAAGSVLLALVITVFVLLLQKLWETNE